MLYWWPAWLGVLLTLVPGLFAWQGARVLLRSEREPLFEERLFDYYRAFTMCMVLVGSFAVLATRARLPLVAVVLFVSSVLGLFSLRRRLYSETWGPAAYVLFQLRAALAWFGFWLLLAFGPGVVAHLPPDANRWLIASAVGSLILLTSVFYAPLFCLLLGARPLQAPELQARFAIILERSTARPPLLFEIAPRGGRWSNAAALPSHPPRVLFGRVVLETLEPDEAGAVFAHEVAHLEQALVRRAHRIIGWLLGPAGVVACAVAARLGPGFATPAALVWPVLVLFAYLALRADRQRWETAADIRAADLCGDAELVARALTKLHRVLRLPRRFSPEDESHLSHPSLDARVAALGTALPGDGTEAAAPASPGNGFRTIHKVLKHALLVSAMLFSFIATWIALNRR